MKKILGFIVFLGFGCVSLRTKNIVIPQDYDRGALLEGAYNVVALEKELAAFKKSEYWHDAVINAGMHAVISAVIGAVAAIVVPLISRSFLRGEDSYIKDVIDEAKQLVPYNIVHGLLQGLITGMVACAGTKHPQVAIKNMVRVHVVHHLLVDMVLTLMLHEDFDVSAFDMVRVPLLLTVAEVLIGFYLRFDVVREKSDLEATLAKIKEVGHEALYGTQIIKQEGLVIVPVATAVDRKVLPRGQEV
jgi:hypothetical protein